MRATFALALSITAMPILVNGQTQSLSSVNQDNSSNKSSLKDSVKDTNAHFAQFIEVLMKSGTDGQIGSNFAPVIGLSKPMPTKDVDIVIRQKGGESEKRGCFVVYEKITGSTAGADQKRPECAYFAIYKRTGTERQARYFRIDLTGKLEKVVLSQGKYDADGKVIRGSGVKTDLDINSPEVKKTFEAEMKFWLKDWLKKQQKVPAKKA